MECAKCMKNVQKLVNESKYSKRSLCIVCAAEEVLDKAGLNSNSNFRKAVIDELKKREV